MYTHSLFSSFFLARSLTHSLAHTHTPSSLSVEGRCAQSSPSATTAGGGGVLGLICPLIHNSITMQPPPPPAHPPIHKHPRTHTHTNTQPHSRLQMHSCSRKLLFLDEKHCCLLPEKELWECLISNGSQQFVRQLY